MPEEKIEKDQLKEELSAKFEKPSKTEKPAKPKKAKPAKAKSTQLSGLKAKLKKIGPAIISFFKNIPSFCKRLFSIPKDPVKFRKKLILLIVFGILFLIVVAIVVFGVGLYKYNWKNKPAVWAQKIIPYPAATVGTDVILLKDYNRRVEYLEHYYVKMKQKPEEGYKKAALEEMIDQEILEREAKKIGASVTDEEVEKQYQNIVLAESGEAEVEKLITELWGFDLDYFKSLIRDTLLAEKMKQEIPISVNIKHILFKVSEGADENARSAILKKAKNLKAEIDKGKDFAQAAKELSEDTATKDKGGDLGWYVREQIESLLAKDCADKVMELKVGGIDICRSKYGFNIVMITDKKGKSDQSLSVWFEEVKAKTHIWRFVGQ